MLRLQRLKAVGVSDENILKAIKENTKTSGFIQKKILNLDNFKYLSDSQKLALHSAITDGRIDVSKWSGKVSGELSKMTREEWGALDKFMTRGNTVHRIPENGIDKVADFVVDGKNLEFKGLKADAFDNIRSNAIEYAHESFPPRTDGKNADGLIFDCVSNGQSTPIEQAMSIANEIKKMYKDKNIEIWTSFGDAVK